MLLFVGTFWFFVHLLMVDSALKCTISALYRILNLISETNEKQASHRPVNNKVPL